MYKTPIIVSVQSKIPTTFISVVHPHIEQVKDGIMFIKDIL